MKPGLALTSCPRPTLTVAEALLLPPLLLTSTSLCRKVDQAPRLSLRLSVVKGVLKSETEAQQSRKARNWSDATSPRPEGERRSLALVGGRRA